MIGNGLRIKTTEKGFTLVELAIVIVIIGLLIGGILVGRSLIGSSSNRNIITSLQSYSAAVDNFNTIYKAYPGDIINAQTIFGTTDVNGNAVTNGNGDSYIGAGDITSQENMSAWQELALAGLIKGQFTGNSTGSGNGIQSGTNVPSAASNSTTSYWFYGTNPWNNFAQAGNSLVVSATPGYGYDHPTILVSDAYDIDVKIDDGYPYQGSVIGYNSNNNNCVATNLGGSPSHTTSTYLVLTTTYCALHYGITGYIFH